MTSVAWETFAVIGPRLQLGTVGAAVGALAAPVSLGLREV
jgi:hypothetical protein